MHIGATALPRDLRIPGPRLINNISYFISSAYFFINTQGSANAIYSEWMMRVPTDREKKMVRSDCSCIRNVVS